MPQHLTQDEIAALCAAALALGLDRGALLSAIPPGFVGSLPLRATPAAQLLSDLHQLNRITALVDGSVPLESWLRSALLSSVHRTEGAVFQAALDRLTAEDLPTPTPTPTPTPPPTLAAFVTVAPFDLSVPGAQALHQVLVASFGDRARAGMLLAQSGVNAAMIDMSGPMQLVWLSILRGAADQGRLPALVEAALADASIRAYHPRIRAAAFTA